MSKNVKSKIVATKSGKCACGAKATMEVDGVKVCSNVVCAINVMKVTQGEVQVA